MPYAHALSRPLESCPGPADEPDTRRIVVRFEPPRVLTASERGVAVHWARGRSIRSIAALRGVAVRTVANQIASIYRRLRVSSRAELVHALARPGESDATSWRALLDGDCVVASIDDHDQERTFRLRPARGPRLTRHDCELLEAVADCARGVYLSHVLEVPRTTLQSRLSGALSALGLPSSTELVQIYCALHAAAH